MTKSELANIEAAAKAGDVQAQFDIGFLYAHGLEGAGKHPRKAKTYLEMAAKAGNSDALHVLGAMYFTGDGLAEDRELGLKMMVAAALTGNAAAKETLIKLGVDPKIFTKEPDQQTASLHTEQKEQAKPMPNFAPVQSIPQQPVYQTSAQVPLQTQAKSYDQNDLDSLAAAADLGDIKAMYLLGNHFAASGDFEQAKRCYEEAAVGGNKEAQQALEQIVSRQIAPEGKADDSATSCAKLIAGAFILVFVLIGSILVFTGIDSSDSRRSSSAKPAGKQVAGQAEQMIRVGGEMMTVLSDTEGHNDTRGYLQLVKNSAGRRFTIIRCTKHEATALVPMDKNTATLKQDGKKYRREFEMKIVNDSRDNDARLGRWEGKDHIMYISAVYQSSGNGRIAVGEIKADGKRLSEKSNVDIVELFLQHLPNFEGKGW